MKFVRIAATILVVSAAGVGVSDGPEGVLCEPFGAVSYRGGPAPDGLHVTAWIEGVQYATCSTADGEYALAISQDDPGSPEKEGWAQGDVIVFKVESDEATPTFNAAAGRHHHDIVASASSVTLDTWGKIKALFR